VDPVTLFRGKSVVAERCGVKAGRLSRVWCPVCPRLLASGCSSFSAAELESLRAPFTIAVLLHASRVLTWGPGGCGR
jgi:hypothetical protein